MLVPFVEWEIQLDGLELLRYLDVKSCEFLEGLSFISSSLRKLCEMAVKDCPKLLEIRFLSTMESLEELRIKHCESLGVLCGLSNLKKLKDLCVHDCNGLQVVEGLEELELLEYLRFEVCGSLESFTDVSNSNIPNECRIDVADCAKLPDTNGYFISYGDYREMILDRTWKPFNEEDVIETHEEESMMEISSYRSQSSSSTIIGSPEPGTELDSRGKSLLLD
ncbi:hypothetical protein NL676_035456 [Syzygium grande]|nr:hypothetical protein NL676_035456 [Syzygium grande]